MVLIISLRLTKLMKEHKISQNALARATGVSQPTINRILCNVTMNPNRGSVVRLANFFGVTPDSMYEPLLTTSRKKASASVDELYEKISGLSAVERSALFSAVKTRHEALKPDYSRGDYIKITPLTVKDD
jgi:transcriptional regulator with XRE-family HTH domain